MTTSEIDRRRRPLLRLFALGLWMLIPFVADRAQSAERDLQLWFPVQIVHPIDERWAISMQTELRLQDAITEFSQLVLKPAVHYHFNPTWSLSAGYKYIDKYEQANEQDPWQELAYNKPYGDLETGLQVRLEQRLIDDIDGIIPRLRLLGHVSHPLGDLPYYLTGFGAVRFNLDDKGEGPVSGFEQLRVSAALGRHIGEYVKVELGYLWRYERERFGSDQSDHAIHLQVIINTRKRKARIPNTKDQYR